MVTYKVLIACLHTTLIALSSAQLVASDQNNKIITYEQATFLCSAIQCGRNIEQALTNLKFSTPIELSNNVDFHDNIDLSSPFNKLIHKFEDSQGNTILHHACNIGHVELAQELIKFDGVIEAENNNGETPLFHAQGYETADELLKHKPNLVHQNNHNQIPLIAHIIQNNIAITQLLLHEMRHISSDTLITIDQFPFKHVQSLDMVRILTKSGACCATIPEEQRARINSRQAFWSCMNTQPNINICNRFNETLLHYAAKENCYDIAEILIHKKINIYAQSITGQTALHVAIHHDHSEFMALLLSYAIHSESQGAPNAKSLLLEKKDMNGSTALMIAVIENKTEIAHYLIDNGADINTRNKHEHTLLHFAKDPILAQKLIDFGLDANSKGMYGHRPLHFAANDEVAQLLIGNEANVNTQTIDNQTPLHLVKNAVIASILIKTGALINRQNTQGQTPLHCAVIKNNIPLCKILLNNNANKYIKDYACRKAKKPSENAIDRIRCDASNEFFVVEDLQALLQDIDRIPYWFESHIVKKIK